LTWCILSKDVDKSPTLAATEGAKEDIENKKSTDGRSQGDLFEENFKELKKWVNVKSTKYGILLVTRERRAQRLGTALKVFCFTSLALVAACNSSIYLLLIY